MTNDMLQAIAIRNASRTLGKWFSTKGNGLVVALGGEQTSLPIVHAVGHSDIFYAAGHWDDPQVEANITFITHAAQDIAALLAEVKRLQRRCAELGGAERERTT